jgi:glutathione synthase/RimK-type ligase-like ATP-grasp enzyme
MKRSVVFLEVNGGNDKGPDGHRRDTMPMIEAVRAKGWNAEVLYYSDTERERLLEELPARFDTYISRINPGHIPGGEALYFEMLRELCNRGMVGMPHPDAMLAFGAKDALVKLRDTPLVPSDTFVAYEMEDFRPQFAKTLSTGIRVLKQNRGSTGSGIWRVELLSQEGVVPGEPLPESTLIRCTEALDNHVEEQTLGAFMDYCQQYLDGDQGMIVDMPYLPRIVEGEIRILFVGEEPIFVVHKKPAEGGFSATLFSGAQYTYEEPEKWDELVKLFLTSLPDINDRLGGHDTPLIWTADFMLDTDDKGEDKYVLGEINCSCVGFTSHLEHGIQEKVANEIINVTTRKLTL